MLYAILCYDSEDAVCAWTPEEDAAVMAELAVAQQKLAAEGKLGPVARLMPTKTAATLRSAAVKGEKPLVIDGPFAETKEQLLGFFMVNCETLEEAVEAARLLGHGSGSLEIRPVSFFNPAAS
jgi:hypothetical protein